MEEPLTIQVKPSNAFAKLILFIHIFAILSCLCTQTAWFFRLLLATVPVTSMLIYLFHYRRQSRAGAILNVSYNNKQWTLQTNTNTLSDAILLGDSYLSRYFIILNFTITGRFFPKSVILAYDAMPAEQFRRLHICLNTNGRRSK